MIYDSYVDGILDFMTRVIVKYVFPMFFYLIFYEARIIWWSIFKYLCFISLFLTN